MIIENAFSGKETYKLSAEEQKALDEATCIVSGRAKAIGATLNQESLHWSLLGVLRWGGIADCIEYAKTARIKRDSGITMYHYA